MPAALDWTNAAIVAGAASLSAALSLLSIHYAHRRALIDLPGRRRAHRVATPRGGGVGIVLAVLICGILPAALRYPSAIVTTIGCGLLLVAGSGWWDDHRPLGVVPRLAVQLVAALALGGIAVRSTGSADAMYFATILLIALTTVWSINLHNFMDGINGLLIVQAVWLFSIVSLLAWLGGESQIAELSLVVVGACLGFVPFNFPRARIFMGDVGSAALGFLIAASLWLAVANDWQLAGIGLLLVSAFAIDAGCTLWQRYWSGRRWYSAHREHLYQWLVRRGRSHPHVVALYMSWNLLLVTPLVLVLFCNRNPIVTIAVVLTTYLLGIHLWVAARHALLKEARTHA